MVRPSIPLQNDRDDQDVKLAEIGTHWQRIMEKARNELESHISTMSTMKPCELRDFLATVAEVYWMDVNALTFDEQVAKKLRGFE